MAPGGASDDFWWAGGIEDTFVPQPHRSGRILDEYELTQHYDRWREDLDLAASLGIDRLRYGLPWHRVEPEPGRFDWAWTDRALEHLAVRLGVEPILDLVHYGCPLWLDRPFTSPDYPERVAAYAAAVAERYGSIVRHYTPLNEPLVNTRFCGYTGQWPPYRRGWRGWVAVLMGIAEGMSRTVAAIRSVQPDASMVHVEACASYVTDDPEAEAALAFTRDRQALPTELLLGLVDEGHPFHLWLLERGASPSALERLRAAPQRIDVMGVNFYPGMSSRRYVRRDDRSVEVEYHGGVPELERTLRWWWSRFGTPVAITETSTPGPVWRRRSWLERSTATVARLRADGMPIVGYTWFPLFSLYRWSYRSGRLDPATYLTHMGLWDLVADGDGGLRRQSTSLVDRYRAIVASGAGEATMGVEEEGAA